MGRLKANRSDYEQEKLDTVPDGQTMDQIPWKCLPEGRAE